MATYHKRSLADPFLRRYEESELRIASEFLDTWLPFLSRDLCRHCTSLLSRRVHSLSSESNTTEEASESGQDDRCVTTNNENCDSHSLGSWKDEAETNSVDNCKDGANGLSVKEVTNSLSEVPPETAGGRPSWADMAQEDELEGDRESDDAGVSSEQRYVVTRRRTELSRDQREYIRFMNVKCKKNFICLERINGKIVSIVQGLELHTGVFSSVEQKRIVNYILELQEKGRRRELKEHTYTAPKKWMRGKGRETIQFGCCYNYAVDKNGNPPGILRVGDVDALPSLFKVMIKRLVQWHVLPPSCVPDSCIVNIYEEGDCIPPHIDSHDFVRPFCTISFLSECSIVFGSELKIIGPGEFAGDHDIPLPMGSVLVLNGNGADLAKHCVPAVPTKRISITFRKMDEAKRPSGYMPEPDLQGLEPLCYDDKTSNNSSPNQLSTTRRGFKSDARRSEEPPTASIYRRGASRGSPRSWGSKGR